MRLRHPQQMESDPAFHLMVGRLVGAAEMTAVLLQTGKLSDDELIDVGRRLGGVASWFLDESLTLPVAHELPSEAGP